MSRQVGGVLSGAIGMLLASLNANSTMLTTLPETEPGSMIYSNKETTVDHAGSTSDQEYPCDWYDPTQKSRNIQYCHSTDIRFFSRDVLSFKQHARYCALKHGVTCVLSHEVDASFFGYYYADALNGERVVVSPVLRSIDKYNSSVLHSIPNKHNIQPKRFLSFAKHVVVEHTTESSLEIINRNVTGFEAFCVQLLFLSVVCISN